MNFYLLYLLVARRMNNNIIICAKKKTFYQFYGSYFVNGRLLKRKKRRDRICDKVRCAFSALFEERLAGGSWSHLEGVKHILIAKGNRLYMVLLVE